LNLNIDLLVGEISHAFQYHQLLYKSCYSRVDKHGQILTKDTKKEKKVMYHVGQDTS
jgi:hypothetical protein